MKYALVLISLFLVAAGCGGSGGSGSSDGGGGPVVEDTPPLDISGDYKGTWNGSGTSIDGPFTCSGTFAMSISQAGSSLVIKMSVLTGTGECDEAFEFSGGGTYNATTGEISMSKVFDPKRADLTGTVVETDQVLSMSGQWSITTAGSGAVLSSGTWTAEPL